MALSGSLPGAEVAPAWECEKGIGVKLGVQLGRPHCVPELATLDEVFGQHVERAEHQSRTDLRRSYFCEAADIPARLASSPFSSREANQDLLQLLRPVKAVVQVAQVTASLSDRPGVSLRDVLRLIDLDHPHHVAGRPLRGSCRRWRNRSRRAC